MINLEDVLKMIDEEINGMSSVEGETTNPKELFDLTDIEGKTELSGHQVMLVSRLRCLDDFYKKEFGIDSIQSLLDNFLKLQISKDRKSRAEFVNAFQSKNDEKVGGLMDKMSFNLK